MKVLLVDDDVFVRRMLAKMIPWAELGFTQVLEAENGEVGVYLVEKEHPLLIVTDVRMPLLSGLELPTTGEAVINGRTVTGPDPERGFVYQTTALFPWLTVMGNVSFGPRVQGVKKEEWHRRAEKYIRLVGLEGFEKSFPNQLSGGMRQRVGIARAYCNEPKVLFLDEPFGHLDAQTRYLMQEEIMRIWDQEKRTVLFVTNNIEEAIYLADRIIVLSNCPTHIKAEYVIDLPRPRNLVDPEFLRLRSEITVLLDKNME